MTPNPALLPAELLRQRAKPPRRGWLAAETYLDHFALITYAVPPERLRPLMPEAFELHTARVEGQERALLSVVPFRDRDFHFSLLPWPRFAFGQTNYRIYVRHKGEECVWFLGTTLASLSVAVPHYLWRLPWHGARTAFDAQYDEAARRYTRYHCSTQSAWATAEITLSDSGQPMGLLPGFDDLDTQRLVLTHPERGYFRRLDGRLGTYSIWHELMQLTTGSVVAARYALLERLGILTPEEALQPHSVLLQKQVLFVINLPPQEYRG